jgi:hypothetical protein
MASGLPMPVASPPRGGATSQCGGGRLAVGGSVRGGEAAVVREAPAQSDLGDGGFSGCRGEELRVGAGETDAP